MNPLDLTPGQLRQAAAIKDQIEALTARLNQILGASGNAVVRGRTGRRMSAAGRARIAAAARARWAKYRGGKPAKAGARRRRKLSPAARKRLAALAKARWAKAKAAGKSRL